MVKFKWPSSKVLLQRILLLGISAVMAREIFTGYLDYNNKVVEYMRSMSYLRARESNKQTESDQHLSSSDEAESSQRDVETPLAENITNE